ncbi:hypothetical protein ACG9X2_10690 [Acinetobacter bereziniae]|uniref:hypothetical protein n=1 Tax=Acinetobacter bereziniae TaxID=106648 RepID=UPI003AF65D1C
MTWKGTKPTDFAFQIINDSEQHLKKISAEMLQGVIVRSPVDQGAFRGNHKVSVNNPDTTSDKNLKDTQGNKTLLSESEKLKQLKLGDTVYIQNNLPYAVRLENGHSEKQAPLGIYGLTFLSVSSKYK